MKMRTLLLAALCMCITLHNVLAVEFSLGGGGLMGYTFTRYTLEGGDVRSIQNMDRLDYAGFVFFDVTYAEFSVMLKGGNNTYSENMIKSEESVADSTGTGREASLGFSLLGKYPFAINGQCTLFPIFGVEYQMALMQMRRPDSDGLVYDRTKGHWPEDRDKNENPYPLSAWNSLWINIGAGLDYTVTGPLFLRGELLFGFRLPTNYEASALEVVKNPPMNVSDPKLAGLTGSPNLRLAVGYRR